MKEDDFRKLEQIEEDQMRLLFKTDKSCSLHLLYLESGQLPARYQIKRMQLNMLQYILKQEEKLLLYTMLMAQIAEPIKKRFLQYSEPHTNRGQYPKKLGRNKDYGYK